MWNIIKKKKRKELEAFILLQDFDMIFIYCFYSV